MSENSNERIEREARESLVAADLSAKMKQWGGQSPPPSKGSPGYSLLALLLLLGVAAWWLWPKPVARTLPQQAQPTAPSNQALPAPTPQPKPQAPVPMAKKPGPNRYVALAQATYHMPDFSTEIRGEADKVQHALNDARQALAAQRPADALNALENIPAEYQTDADYLRGHALFAQRKYAQAAVVFAQLSKSVRYGEAADWYSVLALLPSFEQNNAMVINRLKKMSKDEGHAFQREATGLLEGL